MTIHDVVLSGHLTAAQLSRELGRLSFGPNARAGLLVDCREMTGYDPDARALFVQWNRDHRRSIVGLAIVTDNALWSMVIRAMSLASAQQMRAWATAQDARAWLGALR